MAERRDADLVLEGGGVKGIGLVGACSVLSDAGYRIRRVAGTSAGAIVGALLAAGMTPQQMQDLMQTLDYRQFKDEGLLDRFGPLGKLGSLLGEKGIYEGKALHRWIDELLQAQGVRTFGDLKITDDADTALPAGKSYGLVVMVSDVTRGRLMRLPWDYHLYGLDPDTQPVADAVRASMSIPFFYEPVRLEARLENGKKTICYQVDGGMLSNFPVWVFDRTDENPPRWPTFGVKLSARRPMDVERFDVKEPLGFTRALIGTLTSFHDRIHIEDPSVVDRTIFVDTNEVKATNFDIDELTQQTLFANGRTAAEKFLKTWNFEDHLQRSRSLTT